MTKNKEYEVLKEEIIELVATSTDQRARPIYIIQMLTGEHDISSFTVKSALVELIDQGELVYAYRDPCSYVEIPCNGCDGPYRSARPMKVVTDPSGTLWLCDKEVKSRDALSSPHCWQCGSLAFTRSV